MQQKFQQEAQSVSALTAVSVTNDETETSSSQNVASEQLPRVEQKDELSGFLKRQVRRYIWWGVAVGWLGGIAVNSVVMPILAYTTYRKYYHPIRLDYDFSLASFGVVGRLSNFKMADKPTFYNNGQVDMTVSVLTPLLLAVGAGVCFALVRRQRAKLIDGLAQCQDVHAVGSVIQMLINWHKPMRSQAVATLTRLLPRLRQEDSDLLRSDQRKSLRRFLNRVPRAPQNAEQELALVIVQAYARIGDGTELPAVRWLARGKGWAARDARLREAAQNYLDEVQRRAEQERMPQTLLRASSAADAASEVLLRPAVGVSASDPQQLLRASATEEAQRDLPRIE